MKSQPFSQKLKNASNGIIFTFKTESNFRFHCYSSIAVFLVFIFIQPSLIWWALIIICIALVIAAELANTAIETLLDYMHPEIHPKVGMVKDIMAGMVLSLSILALIIGSLALIDTMSK